METKHREGRESITNAWLRSYSGRGRERTQRLACMHVVRIGA